MVFWGRRESGFVGLSLECVRGGGDDLGLEVREEFELGGPGRECGDWRVRAAVWEELWFWW